MTDRHNDSRLAIIVIEHKLSTVSERHKPFAIDGVHILDGSPDFRMRGDNRNLQANSLDSTCCGPQDFRG